VTPPRRRTMLRAQMPATHSLTRGLRRRPLFSFFVLANLLSWVVWAPLAVAGLGWTTLRFPPYLHLVGGLGPLLAALVVTFACTGTAGLTRLVERGLAVRGRLNWILFAVSAPLLLLVTSGAVLSVAGQGHVVWADVGRSVEYPGLGRGAYAVANVLFYGFGEEVGWRGFALPRLQARCSALTAALLVSCAWAVWHLPLFAFADGLSSLGIGGVAGWLSSIVTGSMLMTWLFNTSRGSVVAVAIFHGVLDIVMTSPGGGPLTFIMGAAVTILGLAIPLAFGSKDLSPRPRVQQGCETPSHGGVRPSTKEAA
jgi:membrane protease YdiL (CAAX protease family)